MSLCQVAATHIYFCQQHALSKLQASVFIYIQIKIFHIIWPQRTEIFIPDEDVDDEDENHDTDIEFSSW